MTRGSIAEYAAAVRERYLSGTKKGKTKILDEFTKVTGQHRKSAIRLLHRAQRQKSGKRRGYRRQYSAAAVAALKVAWETADRLCSKRLKPFLPELLRVLRRHGELAIIAEVEAELCRMSASTIDRLSRPWGRLEVPRPFSTTKPGSLLKKAIPIRTFADWQENRPGFVEVDLVAHCGDNAGGFFLNTLSAVDVFSGWSECVGVWGKGQDRVGGAIHQVRKRLPFPLLGLDSDNGSEFINQKLLSYCRRNRITFTRSRSYKKNDSCHVEQKNWTVVRKLIGYDRYSSREALDCLNRIYYLQRLYVNFFNPVMKLVSKTRNGAKVHKIYDQARTPYQRSLNAGILTESKQQELSATYDRLNPVLLKKQIESNLERLVALRERPVPTAPPKSAVRSPKVTLLVTQ
ncbi:MAG: transposase family protein [Chloroflexota bacterium]